MEAWWQAGGAGPRIAREEGSSPHPVTGEALTIRATWPKYLNVAVSICAGMRQRRGASPGIQTPGLPGSHDTVEG